jgi:hypothetical protein
MFLNIRLLGNISIDYVFDFLPIRREKIDVVESVLHDTQDEVQKLTEDIENLKLQKTQPPKTRLISLNSTFATKVNTFVKWNNLEHNSADDLYTLSENQITITVEQEGLYQVYVRLISNDSSGNKLHSIYDNVNRYTALYVNGSPVAFCYCGQNTGNNSTTILNKVIFLGENSTVQVYHAGNQPTSAIAAIQSFPLLLYNF